MKKILFLSIILVGVQTLSACAIVHRYPAYRGKVLELGTDKPVEGAGVLAVYRMTLFMPPSGGSRYLGYQAVLTDNNGGFKIPPKFFFPFQPLGSFDSDVSITIYKRGYGNFGASFYDYLPKHGVSEPNLGPGHWVPSNTEVTFWFPRLETEEEIREHDGAFSPYTNDVLDKNGFPPPGTRKGQFLPPKYTGEGR